MISYSCSRKHNCWILLRGDEIVKECVPIPGPLWGDKSEYVNTYIPTQTQEEYWSDHMQNHQADSPLYVWPDVWSADLHLFIKNMVIHDIECPYWDQMSLNNTNQSNTRAEDYATRRTHGDIRSNPVHLHCVHLHLHLHSHVHLHFTTE